MIRYNRSKKVVGVGRQTGLFDFRTLVKLLTPSKRIKLSFRPSLWTYASASILKRRQKNNIHSLLHWHQSWSCDLFTRPLWERLSGNPSIGVWKREMNNGACHVPSPKQFTPYLLLLSLSLFPFTDPQSVHLLPSALPRPPKATQINWAK